MVRSAISDDVCAAIAVASQAEALQLTNRDTAEHKISLTEPSGARK